MTGSDHCRGLRWADNGPNLGQTRVMGTGQEPGPHL